MIRATAVCKDYHGVRALEDVTLTIDGGGVTGLLGPNGAGKTTLVEIIEGLRRPSSGTLSVLGMDPQTEGRQLRQRLGVQLQSTALPEELTPLETLRLFGAFFSRSLPPMAVLERMGLTNKARGKNRTLSGGERKRLAIAMALVSDPDLIILDEPTAGLDAGARRAIHAYISELRELEKTVLLTTHYVEEAEKLCDRVVVLCEAKIVADGSPADLILEHDPTVTALVRMSGTFDPRALADYGLIAQGNDGPYHRFAAPDHQSVILGLGHVLQSQSVSLLDLQIKRPTLEDVYLKLTHGDTCARGRECEPVARC
jgi:ABC-2 type transport system ATP-binding protein